MANTSSTGDSGEGRRVEHTPEEEAAFEARAETIGQYADLMAADLNAQNYAATDEYYAAVGRGATEDELRELRRRNTRRLMPLAYALLAVLIALIVAYLLFYGNGTDGLTGIDGDALSSEIAEIAPPVPAATPEEVLPPQVFTATCADCGAVEQVPLDLNKDAKYQFAYETDGTRLAIFTVVDAAQYDDLVATFESSQGAAAAEGDQPQSPIELEGVGDKAVIYGGSAIFVTGEDCGVISGLPKQDAGGVQFMTLSTEELETLARIAVPRM
jgi:hypothetical protein